MKWAAAAAAMLAAALLLAGCGASRPRPARGGWHGASVPAGTDGDRSAAFHDDISKPQESRYRDGTDSVPGGPPPDLGKLAEPIPRNEPRSLYGNKSPYTVRGHTYHVLPSARGYDERGLASYYGNKFQGYKTSDLENYDMYGYSAASKTLPLPSYARVTNLDNGKSVIVRVNDRGPFHRNRVIDLSYAAAVKIGIWPRGVGRVEVQGIDPDQPSGELPPPPAVTTASPGIYLQVGAYSDADNADLMVRRLRRANIAPVSETQSMVNGRRVHRVRVGPLPGLEQADQVSVQIENMGLPRPQVAVD
ncbi:MAG: septal ring lytic transglycosylase RlpA family protein [Xanthomonadaceae bacterium]|nr:septal ring lytic transglycosylase RlpA family protein [Xanthomonadaceae bacterium]